MSACPCGAVLTAVDLGVGARSCAPCRERRKAGGPKCACGRAITKGGAGECFRCGHKQAAAAQPAAQPGEPRVWEAVHVAGPDGRACARCAADLTDGGPPYRGRDRVVVYRLAGPRGTWRTMRAPTCRAA